MYLESIERMYCTASWYMQYRTELYTVKSKSKCDGKVTGYNEKMTEDDIYNTEIWQSDIISESE